MEILEARTLGDVKITLTVNEGKFVVTTSYNKEIIDMQPFRYRSDAEDYYFMQVDFNEIEVRAQG